MRNRKKEKILSHYNNEMEILNKYAKTLSETTDPVEFFSNYDLYMDKLKVLSDAESSGVISVSGDSFCEKYKKKCLDCVSDINEFIDRIWFKVNGNEEEYCKALAGYTSNMPPDSMLHFLSRVTKQDVKAELDPLKENVQSEEPEGQRQTGPLQNEPIPVEKRIEGKSPDCDGLYPHEVLVLSYAHCYCTDRNNKFPGFWWYRYGVSDVQKVLDSLLQRGYIKTGTIEDAVRAENLTVIKDTLKKHGLKTTGKKDTLVQLLVSNVPEDVLSETYLKRTYACTEPGQELLKKYEYIPYVHSHKIEDLDIWNITQLVHGSEDYKDYILKYLDKQGTKNLYDRNYGLYRNTRFETAELMWDEGRAEDAFFHLCEVCAFDLSGAYNGFSNTPHGRKNVIQASFPYEISLTTVAPGVVRRIKKCQNSLGWDEDILKEKLRCTINEIVTPFRIFSNEEIVDIIMGEMNKDKKRVSKIYDEAGERFGIKP